MSSFLLFLQRGIFLNIWPPTPPIITEVKWVAQQEIFWEQVDICASSSLDLLLGPDVCKTHTFWSKLLWEDLKVKNLLFKVPGMGVNNCLVLGSILEPHCCQKKKKKSIISVFVINKITISIYMCQSWWSLDRRRNGCYFLGAINFLNSKDTQQN